MHRKQIETDRAHEKICIQGEEPLYALQLYAGLETYIFEEFSVVDRHQDYGEYKAGILRHDRTHGNARKSHTRIECKKDARRKIHSVYHQIYNHRAYSILHSYKEPLEHIETECGGSSPYSHIIIGAGQLLHLGRALYKGKGCIDIEHLDNPYQKGDCGRCEYSLYKDTHCLPEIPASVRLRHHSACPHPEKAHVPVEQIKEHRGNGHTAYHGSVAQSAGDCKVHHPHQRYGNGSQNAWNGNPQYVPVH